MRSLRRRPAESSRGALRLPGFGRSASALRFYPRRLPSRLKSRSSRRRVVASLKLTGLQAILAPNRRVRRGLTQALGRRNDMTWNCKNCHAANDDELSLCWLCGTFIDGSPSPPGWRSETSPAFSPADRPLNCIRCSSPMEHAGRKKFQEGSYAADLLLGDLFINRESFDIYACSSCGKVEFYVTGSAA